MIRALVVEDSQEVRRIYSAIFENFFKSVECITCSTNAEAYKHINAKKPGLVITDLFRSPMTKSPAGINFVKKLRKKYSWEELPILVVSGRNLGDYPELLDLVGNVEVIWHTKPFNFKVMVRLIRLCIGDKLEYGADNLQKDEARLNFVDSASETMKRLNLLFLELFDVPNLFTYHESNIIDMSKKVTNQDEFVSRIATICVFFERINAKELKKRIKEKRKLKNSGTIATLECFLEQEGVSSKEVFSTWRLIRKLRKIYPIHLATDAGNVMLMASKIGVGSIGDLEEYEHVCDRTRVLFLDSLKRLESNLRKYRAS